MERKLTDLVSGLQQAAGSNLRSVILYGSAASGEFQPKHSDLNVLCLFDKLDAQVLARISPVTSRWTRKGGAAPLVFALDELARAADVFAIELVDIKASHRVLAGEDLMASLQVPLSLHHLQVERELRQGLVRLRQRYLASTGSRKLILGLMTESISSFAALFRHAGMALGAPPGEQETPGRKREAVDRLAALLSFDPRPFHAVLDLREGKVTPRQLDPEALFRDYLAAVTHVVEDMDRRLEERSRG
jgi:hypothetical protein